MDELLDALRRLSDVDDQEARSVADELGLDVSDDATRYEVLGAALQEEASDVWHAIQNNGFAKARDKWKTKWQEAKDQLETVRSEKESLEDEVEELRKDNPDVQKIREDAQEEVEKWKERAQEAEQEAQQRINEFQVDRKMTRLEGQLKDAFARERLAEAEAQLHRDRIQPKDGDEGVEVLQPDSEIPFTPQDADTDPVDLLAERIISNADPKDLESEVDGGGGEESGSGGTSNSGLQSRLEAAREQGQKQGESESGGGGSLEALQE